MSAVVKKSLPVFQGQSVDDHVEAWREADTEIETCLKTRAAIAAAVVKGAQYGGVSSFAERIGQTRGRIYQLAKAHDLLEAYSQLYSLPFEHYVVASYAPDPEAALKEAVARRLSQQNLKLWISVQKASPDSPATINARRQSAAQRAIEELKVWSEVFPEFAHHQKPVIEIIERDANSTPETDKAAVIKALENGCRKVYEIQEFTDNMLSVSRIHHAIDYLMAEKIVYEKAPTIREGNRHNKEREYHLRA